MSVAGRLTEVFETAKQIPFDDSSRFILFSDCHRGDNSWADDFARKQSLYFYALEHYFKEGFTYIELGDGDELWENKDFQEIRQAHSHVFWLLRKFFLADRLLLLWGNHDLERKDSSVVKKTLSQYFDERQGRDLPLIEGVKLHEGLILHYSPSGDGIFLVHDHQGDLINDRYWKVGRFFVRHLWRHLQLLGVQDPTSPAKNYKKRVKVEEEITNWVKQRGQMLIAGHTHRPRFPQPGSPPFFNDGSCVHPRCITGIEIREGTIALIKWWIQPNDAGQLQVEPEILDGPQPLRSYFPTRPDGGEPGAEAC